jgi:malonyl-CoA O-methyltransferase
MSSILIDKQNKARIAKQFSRAAHTYDAAADVQLDIAFDAMTYLPKHAEVALDIGCGTGRISQQLIQRCDKLLAMDIALGMLQFAQQNRTESVGNIDWLQGDAENLPLGDGSMNLLFSSMVLQWCDNQQKVMAEIHRVMAAKGQAVAAIMCEGSFDELHQSWQQIDHQRHVNAFASSQSWQDAATQQGLQVTLHERSYVTWHSGIRPLLASIKSIGANVVLQSESTAANIRINGHNSLNRQTLKNLEACYQQKYAKNSQLPLTYKVCFIHCSKV